MTRRAILLALALALSPILQAAVVQDLTGKWDGTFIATVNGQQEDDVVFMTLTQKGAVLTGTVGPSLDRQWAIIGGKVEGTKVTFDTQSDGPFVKFTLTLVDGRLKGDAVAEMDGQKMTAKVDVGRSK
ncbi:MAG: hypothetical protein IPL75_21845 [Acidobacteria bacterium]|nr:hypothetical protein [Acidobacteriota bacterium]